MIMFGPPRAVLQPIHSVVLVYIVMMLGQELDRLWPESRYAFRRIVEIDGEAVGFVIVLHITKNVVINIAEEVDLRLNAPVPSGISQGRVFVK